MSNKPVKVNEKKAKEICDEVRQKIDRYEARMQTRLARWTEISQLYNGKSVTVGENRKPSPNSSELFKAIRAMRCMIMRMLTGNKPCIELSSNDIIGYEDPTKLIISEHFILQQMELAAFENGLARAIDQLLLFGTMVVNCQYRPVKAPFLGRKMYVTAYEPIPLINCAFALDANRLNDSSWKAISSVCAKTELEKLLRYDAEGIIYDHAAIKRAQDQRLYDPKINIWQQQRLAQQGYLDGFKDALEKQIYYGPLDCMNDDEEYCVEIVNREHIVRMATYEGICPLIVETVNNIDDPLGNGIGDMFRPLLMKIDEVEAALMNMILLAGASMFTKQKDPTDDDSDLFIRQFGIMNLNNPVLNSLAPDPRNIQAVAGYLERLVQQFRQATGATDILQAVVPDTSTTATASSLAMNESVRALSVQSQMIAPVVVGTYAKLILQNAQMYNTQPTTVNIPGAGPVDVMPAELFIDVNVRVKTVTDQDFRPARLQRILEALKMMLSVPPNAIPGKKLNPGPCLMEALKILDVPSWTESVQPITEEDLLMTNMMAQMGQPPTPEIPGRIEQEIAPEQGQINTPVGPVQAAPGDMANTNQAIRQSSVQ